MSEVLAVVPGSQIRPGDVLVEPGRRVLVEKNTFSYVTYRGEDILMCSITGTNQDAGAKRFATVAPARRRWNVERVGP